MNARSSSHLATHCNGVLGHVHTECTVLGIDGTNLLTVFQRFEMACLCDKDVAVIRYSYAFRL